MSKAKRAFGFPCRPQPKKLQAALREIGISTDNPQDFFIAGFSCPEDRHLAIPYDMVLAADVDELNFLAARLDTLTLPPLRS